MTGEAASVRRAGARGREPGRSNEDVAAVLAELAELLSIDVVVAAVAHPSGRRLGGRPPIDCDYEAVFEAAARTGTALELGVAMAQRGWLSREMVVNTWSVGRLLGYLSKGARRAS